MKKSTLVVSAWVICMLLAFSAFAEEKVCKGFSQSQVEVLQFAYDYGAPHDYGWTLAAIAWQESSAGKAMVNWNDPSFGIFAINIKSAITRYGAKTWKEQMILANRLANDREFAGRAAMDELEFWERSYPNNWRKVIQSYNGGYSGSEASYGYMLKISKKLNFLKTSGCIVEWM